MKKIYLLACLAFLTTLAGCSNRLIPIGLSYHFSKSPEQVYSGSFKKDGLDNRYKVRLIPDSADLAFDDSTTLKYQIVLEVSGFGYRTRDYASAYVSANVVDGADGQSYVLSNLKLTKRVDFLQMDPFINVNVWPNIESSLRANLAGQESIRVERK